MLSSNGKAQPPQEHKDGLFQELSQTKSDLSTQLAHTEEVDLMHPCYCLKFIQVFFISSYFVLVPKS